MYYAPYTGETFDSIAANMTTVSGDDLIQYNELDDGDGFYIFGNADASEYEYITIPDEWLQPEYVPVAQAAAGEPVVKPRGGGPIVKGEAVGDWFDKLVNAAPKLLATYNAQQIASVNADRARRNLPPINASLYGPQVGVGMDPSTQQMVLFGALGVAAVMLITKKKK